MKNILVAYIDYFSVISKNQKFDINLLYTSNIYFELIFEILSLLKLDKHSYYIT